MTSFYCKECNKLVEASEGCPHWTFINHKIGNKPKRKSFEFEGNTYFARFLFVGKVFEHYPTGGGGFYFYYLPFDRSKGEYISNCFDTKEAAEAARQELIKLNEELL